jgi:RNA polymerase sigma factor (sigma-70 family)
MTDRDQLVERWLPRLRKAAARFWYKLDPAWQWQVDMDDLADSGVLGLLVAFDRYDETHGTVFNGWAWRHIIGAMSKYTYRQLSSPSRIAMGIEAPEPLDRATLPDEQVQTLRTLDAIGWGLGMLTSQERRAIRLLYVDGLQTGEAMAVMGISQTRVNQLKRAAFAKLRPVLAAYRPDSDAQARAPRVLLRKWRKSNGLTLAQADGRIGGGSVWSKMEGGSYVPAAARAVKIEEMTGIPAGRWRV